MGQIAEAVGVRYVDCAVILSEANVILSTEGAKDLELPTDPHPSAEGIGVVRGCLEAVDGNV